MITCKIIEGGFQFQYSTGEYAEFDNFTVFRSWQEFADAYVHHKGPKFDIKHFLKAFQSSGINAKPIDAQEFYDKLAEQQRKWISIEDTGDLSKEMWEMLREGTVHYDEDNVVYDVDPVIKRISRKLSYPLSKEEMKELKEILYDFAINVEDQVKSNLHVIEQEPPTLTKDQLKIIE